jgi:hypothetical protein
MLCWAAEGSSFRASPRLRQLLFGFANLSELLSSSAERLERKLATFQSWLASGTLSEQNSMPVHSVWLWMGEKSPI